MKNYLILVSLLILTTLSSAQKLPPHIQGKVKVSIEQGTFECDLTLSNLPELSDYFLRLNAGMNILHFRSLKPHDFLVYYDISRFDSMSTGESRAYYFPDNTGKGKFLPQEIQIRYVGKFPVATDTLNNYSRDDWKGNIAFNGKTVRIDGSQSAWYPYLYDPIHDVAYEEMTYNIEVECLDCETIYINGNEPVKAQQTSLKSDKPYELALFMGKYDFMKDDKVIVLNAGFAQDKLKLFSSTMGEFEGFYEKKIGIKFYSQPVFIYTTPTSKYNSWLFVSYPSVFDIDWNGKENILEMFENKNNGDFMKQYFAHELGHYYFGTYKVFNSELGDMISEGFAEYLSLKLVEELLQKSTYNELVKDKLEMLEKNKFEAISTIHSLDQLHDRDVFVYNYAPVLFLAIEKEIGKEKMWLWIKKILESKSEWTDYNFLLTTLKETLNDEKQFNLIVETYLQGEKSQENMMNRLK